MTGDQIAVSADPGSAGDVPTAAPVSFLRWAGPVMAVWVPVCLIFAGTEGPYGHIAFGPVLLFPTYIALYLSRLNAYLSEKSTGGKLVSGASILLISWPCAYVVPFFVCCFSVAIGAVILLIPGLLLMLVNQGLAALWPEAAAGAVRHVGAVLILVTTPVAAGFAHGLFLAGAEESIVGPSNTGRHVLGLMASAVLALLCLLALVDSGLSSFAGFAALMLLPLPHLFVVWRGTCRIRQRRSSWLTPRGALAAAAAVFAIVYVIGSIRFVPDYRAEALVWPSIDPDYDLESTHESAFRRARDQILRHPEGRGYLTLGGRSFLVPAELMDGHWQTAQGSDGVYTKIDTTIPYENWIDGFDLEDVDPAGMISRSGSGRLILYGNRPLPAPGHLSFLCIPRRLHGLRQCVAEQEDLSWLAELGVAVDGLEPVSVTSQRDPIDASHAVFLVAMDETGGNPGSDEYVLLARCGRPAAGAAADYPEREVALWSETCTLEFQDGAVRVSAIIGPHVLEYWQEISAGMRRTVAAWEAAAEGAESIADVARREAEERARRAVESVVYVPLWRTPHRMMAAVIGEKWNFAGAIRP